jgi:hypothetical protein
MSATISVRDDFEAEESPALAGRMKDANQARQPLAIAAILDAMDRGEAARIGGMDRQTLASMRMDPALSSTSDHLRGDRETRPSRKRNGSSLAIALNTFPGDKLTVWRLIMVELPLRAPFSCDGCRYRGTGLSVLEALIQSR